MRLKGKGSIRVRNRMAAPATDWLKRGGAARPPARADALSHPGEEAWLRSNGTAASRRSSGRLRLHRDTLSKWMLVPADVVSTALAVGLGVAVIGSDTLSLAVLIPIPLVVLASKIMGLYDRDQHLLRKTTLDEAPALFQLATLYTLVLWLTQPLLVEGNLGRSQLVGLWVLLVILLLIGRSVARHLPDTVRSGAVRCDRRRRERRTSPQEVHVHPVPVRDDRRPHATRNRGVQR